MKRMHLFEFEDCRWFPACIRDGGTDFLGLSFRMTHFYAPAVKVLQEVMHKTATRRIVDLCSGDGGIISYISHALRSDEELRFTLTDKYPNHPAFEQLRESTAGRIGYCSTSWDILAPDAGVPGIRTMFSAMHHFRPMEVRSILGHCIDRQLPICVFDGGRRSLGLILIILIFHPLMALLGTPFIRPFRWSRLLFTYLLPLIPLYTVWDGIVSVLRLYRPEELQRMAHTADRDATYHWQSGRLRNRLGLSIAYLVGIPKE